MILHYQQSLPYFSILNIILYSLFRSTLTPADIHCVITVLQDGIDFRDIRITKPLPVPDYKKNIPSHEYMFKRLLNEGKLKYID